MYGTRKYEECVVCTSYISYLLNTLHMARERQHTSRPYVVASIHSYLKVGMVWWRHHRHVASVSKEGEGWSRYFAGGAGTLPCTASAK